MITETTTAIEATTGLSAERIAASRATWAGYGYDPAAFDAALAGNPPVRVDGVPEGDDKHRDNAADGTPKMPSLTKEQIASGIAKLRASGMAEDAIQAAMKADGIKEPTPHELELAKYDASFGFGVPHAPADYKIDYGRAGASLQAGELASFDGHAKEFLTGLQMPPSLGAGLVERVMAVGQAANDMEPAARQLFIREQKALGLRASNGDEAKLAETIRLAGVALKHAGPSEFRSSFLKSQGAHDWFVVSTLANHGAHIERWQASRPGKTG
jgi:hypothetical protein